MTVFAAALDALYGNPNFGVAASYAPADTVTDMGDLAEAIAAGTITDLGDLSDPTIEAVDFGDLAALGAGTSGSPPTLDLDALLAAGGIQVTIIWETPDESVALAGIATRLPQTVARVRVSEIAAPQKGDTLTVAGTVYAIGNRERDPLAIEWMLDLKGP